MAELRKLCSVARQPGYFCLNVNWRRSPLQVRKRLIQPEQQENRLSSGTTVVVILKSAQPKHDKIFTFVNYKCALE